jgi:hypothetical protein
VIWVEDIVGLDQNFKVDENLGGLTGQNHQNLKFQISMGHPQMKNKIHIHTRWFTEQVQIWPTGEK